MTQQEAIELIRPAIPEAGGRWADIGAGRGVFTRALATLLGTSAAEVIAVDRDPKAIAALRANLAEADTEHAKVIPVRADFQDLPALATLLGGPLDGALLANALHFAPDPASVLRDLLAWLTVAGRIVIVEYHGRRANPWVPYPVPIPRLQEIASTLPLSPPHVVASRPSRYGGSLYCATLDRLPADPAA
jgi:SAM-dependent methyltransferase